ncbi:hypothetical protein [uncultured Gimesia sp.]|uniref:hypothetical protein n=1 Tax=uncultured Gimesia sp. TaxID=1678688 RepID=UPI002615E1B7|nr:hypothetical protein [uncultured Gimesia sp.]
MQLISVLHYPYSIFLKETVIVVCELVARELFSESFSIRETAMRVNVEVVAISRGLMRVNAAQVTENDCFRPAHCEVVLSVRPEIGLKPAGFVVLKTTVVDRFAGNKSHSRATHKSEFPDRRQRVKSKIFTRFQRKSAEPPIPEIVNRVFCSEKCEVTQLDGRISLNSVARFGISINQPATEFVPFLFRTEPMCIIRYVSNFHLVDWSKNV